MKKNRILYLDCIRGIAIVLIVLGHVLRGLHEFGMPIYCYEYIDYFLYSIHLPILFFLSGFSESLFGKLNKGQIDYKIYIKRNFISLYIPYIIFSYFFWFIKYFIFSGNSEAYLSDIFLIPFVGKWHFWYLISLLLIKIIFGLFERKKENYVYPILLFLTIYIINCFVNISIIEWLSFGFFYALGYATHHYKYENNKCILLACITSIIISIFFITNQNLNISRILLGLPMVYMLIYIFSKCNSYIKYTYVGEYSMVIYLLHTFFTAFIRTILSYFGVSNVLIHILFGLFGSILCCLTIVEIFKKVRVFSCLEYLFYPLKIKK